LVPLKKNLIFNHSDSEDQVAKQKLVEQKTIHVKLLPCMVQGRSEVCGEAEGHALQSSQLGRKQHCACCSIKVLSSDVALVCS
jgi:hypothetical protein